MGFAVLLLSVAMIASGLMAIYSGALIITVERGWSMVIAGAVGASSGAVLLGLSLVAARLKRVVAGVTALNVAFSRITSAVHEPTHPVTAPEPPPPARAPRPLEPPFASPASATGADLRPTLPPEPAAPPLRDAGEPASETAPSDIPSPDRQIVGRHQAGENRYVMFADGSIEAETPGGALRFASMEELRAFVARQRESGAAPSGEEAKGPVPPP
ncbi:MAG: hypothetical protein JO048_17560 [Methylobacteriaceae bacterium]|nr:hypothetical protein [Methylobacteriaceae bacterium]